MVNSVERTHKNVVYNHIRASQTKLCAVHMCWDILYYYNSPVSQWFSPSGEQPEKNVYKLIRYDNQLQAVEQYFTNIAALQNIGVL